MTDRVSERRRAAQLARHYRDQEGLTIAEIARRLGRAEGTVKAYLYDPIGAKAREVKPSHPARSQPFNDVRCETSRASIGDMFARLAVPHGLLEAGRFGGLTAPRSRRRCPSSRS